ncbi:MAG: DUF58 domain-containing protein [Spirochaetales bacterium]|nr:DUF58 domain-containing protein [Spirochaetales bacterium]
MKNLLSSFRMIFPFTFKGFFFFCLSFFFFLTGIFRADLAALFWGCSFLLLTLYAFSGNHIFTILIKRFLRNHPQSINFYFSESGIPEGSASSAHIKIQLPPFFMPGFSVNLSLTFHWQTRKPVLLAVRLLPGENSAEIPFTIHHRGKYTCKAVHYFIGDFFGFTKADIGIPLEECIHVFPTLLDREELFFKITGDESADIQKKRQSNDELLEVKKYYPGDDIRKLNWKIFAHTGELFVRKGEEIPPPDSKFLFILDPTLTPGILSLFDNDFLDGLVKTAGSIMSVILEKGNIIYLSLPGRNEIHTFSQQQEKHLFTLLSSIWWIPEQKKIKLPVKQKMHALVFTSPGSLSLPHVVKELKARDWNISLFFKNFIFPSYPGKKIGLKQFFFVPEKRKQDKKRPLSELLFFKQTLYSEIDRYRTAPWRINDVREI